MSEDILFILFDDENSVMKKMERKILVGKAEVFRARQGEDFLHIIS